MPRNAADFMQEWIADHVDEATVTASLDEMVGQCIADAQRAGLSPADVVDEVDVDIRTLIKDAIERQWD